MAITHHALPVELGSLPLTIARGDGTGAAVIIMPSAFGVTDDLQTQMDELAQEASVVVALDPFFREDAGPAPYSDFPRVMARMQAMDRKRTFVDLRAAIDWTQAQSKNPKLVMLGICFGGAYALTAAADGLVNGIVTWHGSRMQDFVQRASEMRCPMRIHFGSVDPVVPMQAVETVKQAFADRRDVQVIVHEGATHGFSHRTAPAFDAKAEHAGLASLYELIG